MRRLNGYGPSLVVLFTALLVLLLGPGLVQRFAFVETQARMVQASRGLEDNEVLEQLNRAYTDIATFVEPSVVHISATHTEPRRRRRGPSQALSTGSGWLYDGDGHVVTNYHVVEGADEVEIQLNSGLLRPAELVGFDESTDIAVLKVEPGNLHPATRRDTVEEPVAQGELVFAFGSPFDFRFSMSSGIVSGQGRSVGIIGGSSYENFIQVDAAINPGNSGGPLTDRRGRVIAMNTAIATGRRGSLTDEDQDFAGIGLAIPMDMIEPVVDQLIEKGVVEKGLIGVNVMELDRAVAERLGLVGDGVVVTHLRAGGAAERAGLRVEDVIRTVNDQSVSTVQQLRSMISSMLPGEVVHLEVFRPEFENQSGQDLKFDVRLDRLEQLADLGQIPADQDPTRLPELGLARVETSSRDLASRLGYSFRAGVVVLETVPDSPFAQIPPGTVITEVAGYPVASADQMLDVLREFSLVSRGVLGAAFTPSGEQVPVQFTVSR